MKTRDETIRDLAEYAQDQCDALAEKMTAIITGEDDEGEPEAERLCGIGRDKEGRPQLVFSEYGETNRRTVVYVDAILALARLLNGEPMTDMPERIFAWPYKQAHQGVSLAGSKPDEMREYRRADLPPTDEQVMAHPKVKALVEALRYAIDYVEGCKVNNLPDLGAASHLPFVDDVLRMGDSALRDLKGGE